MNDMTISKAAARARVGVETIRFYERKGLIDQPLKPESGFRTYPMETVRRIRFIRQAQELGFTLREIDDLLSLRADPETDCSNVRDRASAKLAEVDHKIARLRQIRAALDTMVAACPGSGALTQCSIMEVLTGLDNEAALSTEKN